MSFRHKYGARKTGKYASRKEAKRAEELRLLACAGKIAELREQVRFEIVPRQDGERAAHYVADFVYREGDAVVVEDVKGFKTREYVLKRKLMKHVHGIAIREM